MGSNQFQREYIEYLQERNTELIGRLNHLKENYENKILSKDVDKHYLMSTLQDVSNICTEIPQEIDLFFDKMTAAMGVLKNILLRKSEMSQLVEKISKAINSTKNYNTDLFTMDDSGLLKEPVAETRSGKKTGTVKVSPMINGHIISTEPRIYLSRVPEVFTHRAKNETHQLSPILEASPDISSDTSNIGRSSFKEISIPVERLNLNKLPFNYISEESPKSRFKGPKTWKKSLSSTKCQSDPKNPCFLENKENINKKIAVEEIENVDPLEGPSWLHNENEMNSSSTGFMDYKRRKHRFATVFDKNEYISSCEEKTLKFTQEGEEEENDGGSGGDADEDGDDDDDGGGGDNDDGDDDIDDGDDDDIDDVDEFYENHETNDDRVDFEEFKDRISESSEDLFCESFTAYEENIQPFKKIRPLSRRKHSKQSDQMSVDKNNTTELEKKFTLEISTYHTKIKKKNRLSPCQLISRNKRDGDKKDIRSSVKNRKSYRKRLSRSIFGGGSLEMSYERTSCESECGKRRARISVNGSTDAGVEQKNSLIKDALGKEVFVILEDCMVKKEIVTEVSKSPCEENVPVRNKLKGESESSGILQQNEGRKKRKAAPTFKLVEPKLKTKLRRN